MNDRELLEFAAKAAGIAGDWELDKAFLQERWYFNVPYDNHNMLSGFEWNPLSEDGDALRLAVKLNLTLMSNEAVAWVAAGCTQIVRAEELFGDNPYAATRRAIVRAAAEIGKKMK